MIQMSPDMGYVLWTVTQSEVMDGQSLEFSIFSFLFSI